MAKLALDKWILKRIDKSGSSSLTRGMLEEYQLKKLNETLAHVAQNSRFYREKLKDFNCNLKSLDEIRELPFTTMEELTLRGGEMLCVPGGDISRIVTLNTSGSTGPPKRIYFTEEDQELTVDYFHHGMQNLVDPSDNALILLPCSAPGGVGDLLKRGLERLGCRSVPYGFPHVSDESVLEELFKIITEQGVTSMVGSPHEVLSIAEFTAEKTSKMPETLSSPGQPLITRTPQIRTVLLSTDYIPDDLCRRLEEIWGCRVFEHYGMTEMGLGGAVSCEVLIGYHPRENDLYFEIIDPATGQPVPEGEYGEIVFTTLTRKGMPLVRYRTGDRSRWIPGPCPCGSVLKRLDKVLPRNVKKGSYNRSR